jgi:hypothetical protein
VPLDAAGNPITTDGTTTPAGWRATDSGSGAGNTVTIYVACTS